MYKLEFVLQLHIYVFPTNWMVMYVHDYVCTSTEQSHLIINTPMYMYMYLDTE